MRERSEPWIFGVSLASATAVLVSIAASQILLALACLLWIVFRPRPLYVPRYFLPLGVFMGLTVLALAMSPDPSVGAPPVRKFVLYAMGLVAANFVTRPWRARMTYGLLLVVAAAGSGLAIVQFGFNYARYLGTGNLADDPTVLARVTGFMSHWMTFSGEQLLVWCAAIPILAVLGRRWIVLVSVVGAGIVVSFTRSAWLGAMAGAGAVAFTMPRRLLLPVLLPVGVVGLASSPLIYQRISMSFEEGFGPDAGRLALLGAGFEMVRDHPVFGVGLERIPIEFPGYYDGDALDSFYYGHMHNNFMQIAAERGLPALAAFLWFLIELYRGLFRLVKRPDPAVRATALSAIAALTGFLVAGLFEHNFGDSEVLMLFLFLVTIPFGLAGPLGEKRHFLTTSSS